MAGHDYHKSQERVPSTGKFTTPPLELASRRAEAARLRGEGWTYRAIATQLGIDVHTAHDDVKEAVKAIVQEPAQTVLQLELDRLDAELRGLNELEETVRTVLETQHFTVSHGKVIYVGTEPLLDDGPVLQAVDRLMRIEEQRRRNGESRRKLLGMDAPSRVSVEADQIGQEIGRILDQLAGASDDGDA
jgi:hypothetical protein